MDVPGAAADVAEVDDVGDDGVDLLPLSQAVAAAAIRVAIVTATPDVRAIPISVLSLGDPLVTAAVYSGYVYPSATTACLAKPPGRRLNKRWQ